MVGKKFLDRIERVSNNQFQEIRKTDDYRELNNNPDPNIRAQLIAVLDKRKANDRKREKLLSGVYKNPNLLDYIRDMQEYRDLRIEQAWLSISIREGQTEDKPYYTELDRRRRSVHNKALASFCRLVEKTSILPSRDNLPPKDGKPFLARNENLGDLYDGPLMIPDESPDKYGNHAVREAMTDGMFRFLKLIEETPREDWDLIRARVIERINNDPTAGLEKLQEVQTELNRTVRNYGMDESPDRDDFSTDLFGGRDNRYKKRNSIYDGLDFGGE